MAATLLFENTVAPAATIIEPTTTISSVVIGAKSEVSSANPFVRYITMKVTIKMVPNIIDIYVLSEPVIYTLVSFSDTVFAISITLSSSRLHPNVPGMIEYIHVHLFIVVKRTLPIPDSASAMRYGVEDPCFYDICANL